MNVIPTDLPGCLIVEPVVHRDNRGYLLETWKQSRYAASGIDGPMLQDNLSFSRRGVLRGLHFQHPHGQAKLVSAVVGDILDVAVDLRVGSPTFARWFATRLSEENRRQLYIPAGFAHGFCVMSASALVWYQCSAEFLPDCSRTILWNDPRLAIAWPLDDPVLSEKDAVAPTLAEFPPDQLPRYPA